MIKLITSPPDILSSSRHDSPSAYFQCTLNYSSLNIWISSISQTMPPQWGLFFSQWCYRCSSLCGGGLTPLTMMQITYLSCHIAFAAFPLEMLLLPGQTLWCVHTGLAYVYLSVRVVCVCVCPQHKSCVVSVGVCPCLCVNILELTVFKACDCHSPELPSWWWQWFIENTFNSQRGFRPTEKEADFCGEENDRMSTAHKRTVSTVADAHFKEYSQSCCATGLACFHLCD